MVWSERPFACSCSPMKSFPHWPDGEKRLLALYDAAYPDDRGATQDELDYQRDVQTYGADFAAEWWGAGVDLAARGHALADKLRDKTLTA